MDPSHLKDIVVTSVHLVKQTCFLEDVFASHAKTKEALGVRDQTICPNISALLQDDLED